MSESTYSSIPKAWRAFKKVCGAFWKAIVDIWKYVLGKMRSGKKEIADAAFPIRIFFRESSEVIRKHKHYHLSIPVVAVLIGETVRITLLHLSPEDSSGSISGEQAPKYSALMEILLMWGVVSLVAISSILLGIVRTYLRNHHSYRFVATILLVAAAAFLFKCLIDQLNHSTHPKDLLAVMIAVATAFVTFVVVIAFLIRKDTLKDFDPRTRFPLTGITEVFATSAIDLKEWFEPKSQVYFAYLTANCPQKDPVCSQTNPQCPQKSPQIKILHHRVLLMETRDGTPLHEHFKLQPHLDHHFAECLAEMHADHGIPLYYMEKAEVLGVVRGLNENARATLGIKSVNGRTPLKKLDFVLFENATNPAMSFVVSFSKQDNRITDPSMVAVYRALKQAFLPLAAPKPFRPFVQSIT